MILSFEEFLKEELNNDSDIEETEEDNSKLMTEHILNRIESDGIVRGRLTKFRGGGYRVPISFEGHIFYLTVKEA